MGFELSQGKETLHHPDKLHVHLRDNSVWGRNVQLDCVPAAAEGSPGQRCQCSALSKVKGTTSESELSSVPRPKQTAGLLPPFVPPSLTKQEKQWSLPWTIWGCLFCWMDHNGGCSSQTVCGLGKPPSQSATKTTTTPPITRLESQLQGQPLVRVQPLVPPALHLLTPPALL